MRPYLKKPFIKKKNRAGGVKVKARTEKKFKKFKKMMEYMVSLVWHIQTSEFIEIAQSIHCQGLGGHKLCKYGVVMG
jgi:hypothetical protein